MLNIYKMKLKIDDLKIGRYLIAIDNYSFDKNYKSEY